jgi:cation transport ATPase
MTFCPRCGASLKGTATGQPTPPTQKRDEKAEKNEKNEKNEKHESREKQEKGERGFVGYLIGGLILITLGAFAVLQITNPDFQYNWAYALLIVGVIIIIGAVYMAFIARRRHPIPR